jgi:hypothetical protein
LSATNYAANIVGGVTLLRQNGASRVVLIASGQGGELPQAYSAPDDESVDREAQDAAYEGFLDLITARATTPAEYAHLIAQLVDTIRDVIDTVVGVVHLISDRELAAARVLREPVADVRGTGGGSNGVALQNPAAGPISVTVSGSRDGSRAAESIARLYTWAMYVLRTQEIDPRPRPKHDALEAHIARRRPRLSETIWQMLDPVWHEIVHQLVERNPQVADALAELDRLLENPECRPQRFGRAWAHFDVRARLDWLSACAEIFPLHSERLRAVEGAADA